VVAGSAVCVTALVAALRVHVKASELPPTELALHHWRRTKAAGRAGIEVWQYQVPAQVSRASKQPLRDGASF
jgi:hypothetical protein